MTYRAHQTLENHHKNGHNAHHFYHFQITITGSMSESIVLNVQNCAFHGFQRPKFRVHPAPKVHDFVIRCMNFSSHFEHLICHIKHGADMHIGQANGF